MIEKTILNVEDEPTLRKLVRHLFRNSPIRIIEASNGEEAVSMAQAERPDLILMDIQLPRLSGYEATRTIKADPELAHIPIIAVTGFALQGEEEKSLSAGCDAYIPKPYQPLELKALVESHLHPNVPPP